MKHPDRKETTHASDNLQSPCKINEEDSNKDEEDYSDIAENEHALKKDEEMVEARKTMIKKMSSNMSI